MADEGEGLGRHGGTFTGSPINGPSHPRQKYAPLVRQVLMWYSAIPLQAASLCIVNWNMGLGTGGLR
ncbi:hypothetical protein K440DRAFT_617689 [Wilcoxina mikolae CBS 423.85]|nr:hypothetical protein K440DRAFT_617689 [Wilcoxina mikolae CBS 423.85]